MVDPMASFQVRNIVPMNVFGVDISITNSAIFMFLAVAVICGVFWVGTTERGLLPTKLQVVIEQVFFLIGGIVKSNTRKKGAELLPYMMALFLFIMIGNVIGLFPFAFSYTSQLCVTIGMASIVFIASIVIGLINQKMAYFRRFCPSGIPGYLVPFFVIIELLSFMLRPLILSPT